MIKLAESSGTVIYDSGNKLYITKKPAQWTSTFLFVTGLLAFLFIANGVLQLFLFKNPHGAIPFAAILLTALGVTFIAVFWSVLRYRKKINNLPFDELKQICVIDFTTNNLLDSEETILCSLNDVILDRKMQLGSSSPALILKWNKNKLLLVKGSPFSGGVSAVEGALISKGINS